jgi:hypothetical protein
MIGFEMPVRWHEHQIKRMKLQQQINLRNNEMLQKQIDEHEHRIKVLRRWERVKAFVTRRAPVAAQSPAE